MEWINSWCLCLCCNYVGQRNENKNKMCSWQVLTIREGHSNNLLNVLKLENGQINFILSLEVTFNKHASECPSIQ